MVADESGDREASTRTNSTAPPAVTKSGRRLPWLPRPPVWGRLKRARAERDQARADLRSARNALKSAQSDVERARVATEAARAELANARADSEQIRADFGAQLTRHSDSLANELDKIRAQQETTDRRVMRMAPELLTETQALLQLLGRYQPEARLPPVAGWALSPGGLLAVVDLIEKRGARFVLECGSGTSTVWIGYALKRIGRGRLVALDHMPEYAEKTRAMVVEHGLEDFVEVRLAPLAPRATPRGDFSWYSVDAADLADPIDVLLVDGPPGTTGQHARYPALPVFVDYLASRALVVADDVNRRDEREMVEFWLQDETRLRRVDSPSHGVEVLEFSRVNA